MVKKYLEVILRSGPIVTNNKKPVFVSNANKHFYLIIYDAYSMCLVALVIVSCLFFNKF